MSDMEDWAALHRALVAPIHRPWTLRYAYLLPYIIWLAWGTYAAFVLWRLS